MGLKLFTKLRLGLSHLREHMLKRRFHYSLSLYCTCRNDYIETSCHILLYCSNSFNERLALLNSLRNVDHTILQQRKGNITHVLLFCDTSNDKKNQHSLNRSQNGLHSHNWKN